MFWLCFVGGAVEDVKCGEDGGATFVEFHYGGNTVSDCVDVLVALFDDVLLVVLLWKMLVMFWWCCYCLMMVFCWCFCC